MKSAIRMENIVKRFPGVLANDHVSLDVAEGEVHGLVGENGAGKSTLMHILYGMFEPDSGQIFIRDAPVNIRTPMDAIRHGIGMVHQHFMLVSSLTVLENVVLGFTPTRFGMMNLRQARDQVKAIEEKFSLNVDLDAKVYQLSVGEMQRTEILKALYRGAKFLILDEPTSVLVPQEIKHLFHVLRELARKDHSIIFITHKLKEVLSVTNYVTVLQRGKITGQLKTSETNEQQLANMMVGRDVVLKVEKSPTQAKGVVLQVSGVSALSSRNLPALKKVSFAARYGEIVGVAGVEGNGQTELIEILAGLRSVAEGQIYFRDKEITSKSVKERRKLGIAHIPEDRLTFGVSKECSIEENLILNKYYTPPLSTHGVMHANKVKSFCQRLLQRFDVKAAGIKVPITSLSGGNMQKLVLARELDTEPHLLIAAQPGRGVDIGALEYIQQHLIELRDRSRAILLISSELDDIMMLADRILVMYEGEIVGSFVGGQVGEEELGLYMSGAKRMKLSPDGEPLNGSEGA